MGIVEKVQAQINEDTLGGLVLVPRGTGDMTWQTLIGIVAGWVFVIAGVVAFFYLVFSGFVYLTAGGNPESAKKGQQGIINAIIGLVIIMLAYAIVRAVVNLIGS